RIEDLGYAVLLTGDYLLGSFFAPGPALMAAAAATTTLRVGCSVFANDFRHPALLAKEMATLDVLCDGRLECGIGAGWLRSEYDQAGIPFDRGGVRVGRLEEAVHIIKGLWSGEALYFSDRYYTISGLTGLRPLLQPQPPLYIGAGG